MCPVLYDTHGLNLAKVNPALIYLKLDEENQASGW